MEDTIDKGVKVNGFRKSSTAPLPRLAAPVARRIHFSNQLAGAVLKVWAESHETLRDAVAERLETSGMAVEYPDFDNGGFRGHWSDKDWRRARDEIIKTRGGEFAEDDVLLMLCYAAGRMPASGETFDAEKPEPPTDGGAPRPNAESGESDMKTADRATGDSLSAWMRSLESLPSASDMWDTAIPAFSERLAVLIAEKAAERGIPQVSQSPKRGLTAPRLCGSVAIDATGFAHSETTATA